MKFYLMSELYEILYCYQFGFWKNHSTSMALIHLVNKITYEHNAKPCEGWCRDLLLVTHNDSLE